MAAVSDCLSDFEDEVASHGTVRAVPLHAALRLLADDVLEIGVEAGRVQEREAHTAERDAMYGDLGQLLRTLGMFDGARPQSSHEVMLEAIAEVAKLREDAEAVREQERQRIRSGLPEVIERYRSDLAFTAPELHPVRLEQLAERIGDLITDEEKP